MRGILGEESGLLPVGLQGETERQVQFNLSSMTTGQCSGNSSFIMFKWNLLSGDSPLFPVIIQLLIYECLSGKAELLQQTKTPALRFCELFFASINTLQVCPLTSLSVLLFSLMTFIQSSMSSRSSACSRYSQKSWVVSRRACLRLVSLYAMSTRQPRMLIGCSSSAPPSMVAPRSTASLLSL